MTTLDTRAAVEATLETIEQLPLDAITPAPDNPRLDVGDVAELAQSMKELGVLQPLIVTPRNGGYMAVVGHRRLAAAKKAALATVPALIRDYDEPQRVKAMLIENCQREGLAPLEEARAYRGLVDLGLSQRKIASDVGKTQSHVSKRVALLDLPGNVQKEVDSGGITIADAQELLKLKDHPNRLGAAFSRRGQYRGGLGVAVELQLDELEDEQKVAAAKAELKAAGVTTVAYVRNNWHDWDLPKNAIRLDGWEARDLKISPKGHAKEPCHAAAIHPRGGEIVYVCTNPARHKGKGAEKPEDEKQAARAQREREKKAQLKAREKNVELGHTLTTKLAAPKIDATNMRLLAELLFMHDGADLAAFHRLIDETAQTVITKKDGSVSRIQHAQRGDARRRLDELLAEAKTPEQIMGVVLQALAAARYADTNALPPSDRYGSVRGVSSTYGPTLSTRKTVEAIAAPIVRPAATRKKTSR